MHFMQLLGLNYRLMRLYENSAPQSALKALWMLVGQRVHLSAEFWI